VLPVPGLLLTAKSCLERGQPLISGADALPALVRGIKHFRLDHLANLKDPAFWSAPSSAFLNPADQTLEPFEAVDRVAAHRQLQAIRDQPLGKLGLLTASLVTLRSSRVGQNHVGPGDFAPLATADPGSMHGNCLLTINQS
jgi:hypothetical protein